VKLKTADIPTAAFGFVMGCIDSYPMKAKHARDIALQMNNFTLFHRQRVPMKITGGSNRRSVPGDQANCAICFRVQIQFNNRSTLPTHVQNYSSARMNSIDGALSLLRGKSGEKLGVRDIGSPARLDECLQHPIRCSKIAVNLRDARWMRIPQIWKCRLAKHHLKAIVGLCAIVQMIPVVIPAISSVVLGSVGGVSAGSPGRRALRTDRTRFPRRAIDSKVWF